MKSAANVAYPLGIPLGQRSKHKYYQSDSCGDVVFVDDGNTEFFLC